MSLADLIADRVAARIEGLLFASRGEFRADVVGNS